MTESFQPQRTGVWGVLILLGLAFLASGCGGKPHSPLTKIKRDLQNTATYSIVLDDMKEEGSFFKKHFHRYLIVISDRSSRTDWREVSKKFFKQHLPYLGMTVYTKKDGKEVTKIGPPGYEYVGDSRYGSWNSDSGGRSFWVFYGQYRLLSDLLGGGLIYRDHHRTYASQSRPYYGPNKEYGTEGSVTRAKKPDFYARRMSKQMTKRSSFSNKVNRRVGRSRTNLRGRSGGRGK